MVRIVDCLFYTTRRGAAATVQGRTELPSTSGDPVRSAGDAESLARIFPATVYISYIYLHRLLFTFPSLTTIENCLRPRETAALTYEFPRVRFGVTLEWLILRKYILRMKLYVAQDEKEDNCTNQITNQISMKFN